jgi:hypothetical protein
LQGGEELLLTQNFFFCTGGAYYVPYSCLLISN